VSAPSLSVILPTRLRPESLRRALTALARQDVPAAEFEVVVSVDGRDARTQMTIATFEAPYDLIVVDGPGRGRAAACNAALERARGDVVVILDDDMEPAQACLGSHRRHHGESANVCVMGAVPVHVDRDTTRAGRFIAWKFDLHLENLARPGHVFRLRDFFSGNTSIRRNVLMEVGGFDETFTAYGNEDLELSLRLRAANVALVYDRDALAYQHYEKSLAELARDTFEKGTTAVALVRSHPAAFGELQLAEHGAHSRRWRALRSALLWITRRQSGIASAVLQGARALEHTPIARRPLFYILLLDYFYWLGVQSVLGEGPAPGVLAQLETELRHGPIRLLLHR
jgi:GT2 family glycosyltransferase